MMRLLLTTIILTMLAQPAWAQTVYYCLMLNVAQMDTGVVSEYRTQKFSFSLTDEKVIFGSGGYFDGLILEVDMIYEDRSGFVAHRPDLFGVDYTTTVATLEDGQFNYADILENKITVIHATCDKF